MQHVDFDWEIRKERIVKMRQTAGDGDTITEELAEPEYQTIYICVKRGSDPLTEVWEDEPEISGEQNPEGQDAEKSS